ncbi:HlyD family type I secretion periplasmic adaptor subunit [Sulfurimonas sp. HSL-1716]|uniref:HlyD family type I secretion periplasmic adaptor subunit n=1 Tax=Hydrocurvibacter sulfurireducens TaxID=3131937 RepID=UPI0031F879E2
MANNEFNERDYEFMQSLSAAILEKTPSRISRVLKIWLLTIAIAIIWASFASIDEITRGSGKVIPYGQNQKIQNLEGGIVESIMVHEGDEVKKDQIILKINNSKSTSTATSNVIKLTALKAKKLRLQAEANLLPFHMPQTDDETFKTQLTLENKLYTSDMEEYKAKDDSLVDQIEQKKQEYREALDSIDNITRSLRYVQEEIEMTAPMVREGVKSKVDFLKLKREGNDITQKLDAAKSSLPRLKSAISEYRNKRIEAKQKFVNDKREELNKATSDLEGLSAEQVAFTDQVNRTLVRSPVNGIVQKLFINTVGGVIKPGDDLVEIVPTSEKLYLEVKIKPTDIAFIHPGAEAQVKFTAYDYAIYGGLVGKVVNISPDSITDEKDNTYYLIKIETAKNYLGTKEHPLKIIPGMVVNVNIVTGKKTVMEYILKPILKSKQYVFTER